VSHEGKSSDQCAFLPLYSAFLSVFELLDVTVSTVLYMPLLSLC